LVGDVIDLMTGRTYNKLYAVNMKKEDLEERFEHIEKELCTS